MDHHPVAAGIGEDQAHHAAEKEADRPTLLANGRCHFLDFLAQRPEEVTHVRRQVPQRLWAWLRGKTPPPKPDSGGIAIAHNGNLTNADTLRKDMEQDGAIFQSSSTSPPSVCRNRSSTPSWSELMSTWVG